MRFLVLSAMTLCMSSAAQAATITTSVGSRGNQHGFVRCTSGVAEFVNDIGGFHSCSNSSETSYDGTKSAAKLYSGQEIHRPTHRHHLPERQVGTATAFATIDDKNLIVLKSGVDTKLNDHAGSAVSTSHVIYNADIEVRVLDSTATNPARRFSMLFNDDFKLRALAGENAHTNGPQSARYERGLRHDILYTVNDLGQKNGNTHYTLSSASDPYGFSKTLTSRDDTFNHNEDWLLQYDITSTPLNSPTENFRYSFEWNIKTSVTSLLGKGSFADALNSATFDSISIFDGAGNDITYNYNFFDGFGNEVFNASSISAVPLPAAGWMLLAGLGGMGLMRNRKVA